MEFTTEEKQLLIDAFFYYRQNAEFQNADGDITDEEYEAEVAQVIALMQKIGLSSKSDLVEPF